MMTDRGSRRSGQGLLLRRSETRDPPFVPRVVTQLEDAFAQVPPGPCPPDAPGVADLCRAWTYLHGGSADGMRPRDLARRIRTVAWEPPVLSLSIDRSDEEPGRTAVQHWQVDVQDGIAWIADARHLEMPAKMSAAQLAVEVARAIVAGEPGPAVVLKSGGEVAVRPGDVPGLDVGFAETLAGRHNRFRLVLDQALEQSGFVRVGRYRYARAS